MKEIKAYVHRNRIAAVIAAVKTTSVWGPNGTGDHNLTVYMVKGSLVPLESSQKHYSLELGDEVVNEYKLELHCSDEHVDELVELIRNVARTGQSDSGWIYVADIAKAVRVM